MRPRLLLAVLAAFVVSLPLAPTVRADQFRATAEPPAQLIGTWRLNVGKSKYSPGPPLRSETRVLRAARTESKASSRACTRRSRRAFRVWRTSARTSWSRESREHDSVTLRKVDELTSDAVLSHAGNVYGVARRSIAADGRTMTITFDRKSQEARVHNVAVRQGGELGRNPEASARGRSEHRDAGRERPVFAGPRRTRRPSRAADELLDFLRRHAKLLSGPRRFLPAAAQPHLPALRAARHIAS